MLLIKAAFVYHLSTMSPRRSYSERWCAVWSYVCLGSRLQTADRPAHQRRPGVNWSRATAGLLIASS